MGVFGIEYRPQFVQSDIGAMQKRFDEMQHSYDQSYAGALAAEDLYSQYETDVTDVALKNEIIGNFRNKVQSIVDKYGGDWGAAAKQLAKEVVKTKQDPFFQLAGRKKQLAEEQRKMIQAYGPDAVVLKDIRNVQLKDKEGKYIDPSKLESEVLNRAQIKEMMNKELGHLAKDIREGEFAVSKKMPWQMERKIMTGISDAEVMGVAQRGYELIKSQRPDLPDDVAMDIAISEARSYVGDVRTDFTSNEPWKLAQERAEYDRRRGLETRTTERPPMAQASTQSYFNVTDDAVRVKQIKSKLVNSEGKPLAAAFGERGELNPMQKHEKFSADKYVEERGGKKGLSTVDPVYGHVGPAKKTSESYLSPSEYAYLKKIGVTSKDDYKTVISKVNNYETKQAVRYSKYRLDMSDYSYVTDMLSAQIPKGAKISGSTGIIQPLDKNLRVKGGVVTRRDFEKNFYDDNGDSAVSSLEFIPHVGLVASTSDGKMFKIGSGGIKDQISNITSDKSLDRQVINAFIESGNYREANEFIHGLINESMVMLTNAQVSNNPFKFPN
jgi:hypothetical protein